jgi:hypothetical protein
MATISGRNSRVVSGLSSGPDAFTKARRTAAVYSRARRRPGGEPALCVGPRRPQSPVAVHSGAPPLERPLTACGPRQHVPSRKPRPPKKSAPRTDFSSTPRADHAGPQLAAAGSWSAVASSRYGRLRAVRDLLAVRVDHIAATVTERSVPMPPGSGSSRGPPLCLVVAEGGRPRLVPGRGCRGPGRRGCPPPALSVGGQLPSGLMHLQLISSLVAASSVDDPQAAGNRCPGSRRRHHPVVGAHAVSRLRRVDLDGSLAGSHREVACLRPGRRPDTMTVPDEHFPCSGAG